MDIRDRIKRNEKLRLRVYDDATGKNIVKGSIVIGNPTIGYGRELSKNGISDEEAELLLDNSLQTALDDIKSSFRGIPMSQARQDSLVDMRYQLGYMGFRRFERMIAAIRAQDWTSAALECLDSDYARQCHARAQENAADLESG